MPTPVGPINAIATGKLAATRLAQVVAGKLRLARSCKDAIIFISSAKTAFAARRRGDPVRVSVLVVVWVRVRAEPLAVLCNGGDGYNRG
jgi:hypothetical protein